jgi:hypothetical protein
MLVHDLFLQCLIKIDDKLYDKTINLVEVDRAHFEIEKFQFTIMNALLNVYYFWFEKKS